MFRVAPSPNYPVKRRHLLAWAFVKAAIWATLATLWLFSGQVPWKAALVGEIIAYGPIPIYLAWVAWQIWRNRKREAAAAAVAPV